MSSLIEQVFDLIKLNNPLVAIESPLQERLTLLKNLAKECQQKNVDCYLWTLEDDQLYRLQVDDQDLALQQVPDYQAITKSRREHHFEVLRFWKTTNLQGILILEGIFPWLGTNTSDPDFFLTSAWIKSTLINLKLYNCNSNKTAILLGPNANLSSDIAAELPTITQQLPTVEEITVYLRSTLPQPYSETEINDIANASVGMYLADIDYGIKEAIAGNDYISAAPLTNKLSTYKINLLKRVYNIEFLKPPAIEVGGLELIQESFKKYKRLMTPLAKTYNLRLPKGVLLIGPPGTGR